MKVVGVEHTSFTVSNLDRTLEFYIGMLGLELRSQRVTEAPYFCEIIGFPGCKVRVAVLNIPGSNHLLELFEYLEPRGIQADVRTNNVGSSHVSYLVEDLQEAYQELKDKGVRFRTPPVEIDSGPNKGGWGLYCLDPDGITIELFQP